MTIRGTRVQRPETMPEDDGRDWRITPGFYRVRCTSAAVEYSKKGNAMVALRMEITEGQDHGGREIRDWITLLPSFEGQLWSTLDAFLGDKWDGGKEVDLTEQATSCEGHDAWVKLWNEDVVGRDGETRVWTRVSHYRHLDNPFPQITDEQKAMQPPPPQAPPSYGNEEPF